MLKVYTPLFTVLTCLTAFNAPAFADDSVPKEAIGTLREAVTCNPAKGLIEAIRNIEEIDAEDQTVVKTKVSSRINVLDDGELPQRFFLKTDQGETDLTMQDDGEITDINKLAGFDKDTELCVDDPSRAGLPKDERYFGFSMNLNTSFDPEKSEFSLAELERGLKEGRKHYVAMFGGGMKSMLIPKMTHLIVTSGEDQPLPEINAQTPGGVVPIETERFGQGAVIRFKDLKKMDAEKLILTGGDFALAPTVSPKKMRQFGFGPQDDDSAPSETSDDQPSETKAGQ